MSYRVDCFHVNQIWESPRGFLYKVVGANKGGQATLRLGSDGRGRIVRRKWDDVVNWVLVSDPDEEKNI